VSDKVDRHISWALAQQENKKAGLALEEKANRQQKRLTRAVEKGLPRDA
jgi:epoxyqueuosine reductase